MRKGKKLGKCPKCEKKGLIKYRSRHYKAADCRYCKHHIKAGWAWSITQQEWIPIIHREFERKVLESF